MLCPEGCASKADCGVMFRALDMLEAELATICPMEGLLPQTYRDNQEQDLHKLRLLLERECAAQVSAITCANTCLTLFIGCPHWHMQ